MRHAVVPNQPFGKLTAVRPADPSPSGHRQWEFVCECGNPKTARVAHVVAGRIVSCGCHHALRTRETNRERTGIRPGAVYARLTAVREVAPVDGQSVWLWDCECGARVEVGAQKVKTGHAKSCGCLRRDASRARRLRHGHTSGHDATKEYRAWSGMKRRCLDPTNHAYADYGGRGITVCDRWQGADGFAHFLADLGPAPTPNHTLERVDNDGPYSPENCVWLPQAKQTSNRRNNVRIEYAGRTLTAAEWARETGLKETTIRGRLAIGWEPARTLTTPMSTRADRVEQPPRRRLYRIYCGIKTRCGNPKAASFARYGARGITVCERWRESFEAFVADVGLPPSPAHSLDRVDNDRGYEPGNVRWATRTEQSNNQRNNVNLTHGGRTMSLTAWAREVGLSRIALAGRLARGWAVDRALTTPAVAKTKPTAGVVVPAVGR